MATDGGAGLTIDQLAQETGMTVRNIRAHQSRGLLPPPEVRARTGFYGPEHVARLRLIAEMQADGFNLTAIQRLLGGTGGAGEELLGFKRELMAPFETEQPEVVDGAELAARWGGELDAAVLRRAEKLELIRPLGEDRYEIPSPTLHRAGQELLELGVPLKTSFAVVEQLRRHSQGVARAFVRLFVENVWQPFEKAGFPEDQWPDVRNAIERLRPMASDSLLAVFRPTMTAAVEEAFGRELERRGRRGRDGAVRAGAKRARARR